MKEMDAPAHSSGAVRLVMRQGPLAGQEFALKGTAVLVGRGAQCDIVLQEHLVSREHARFQLGPQGWILTDLGSTNSTLLNGQPLRPHETYPLEPGDQVTIGSTVLVFGQAQGVGAVAGHAPSGRGGLTGPPTSGPRPVRLIAGILIGLAVLVTLVVVLVILLQPDEEKASPQPLDLPAVPIGTVLSIPTLLEDIGTVLPTQLQDLTTALPTQLQDLSTALPIPTQLEPMATSILPSIPTGLPDLPGLATATPAPAAAARNEAPVFGWGWMTGNQQEHP